MVLAELSTRGFVGRPGPTIALATVAGMLAMSVAFTFEPPIFVPMLLLVGGILLVIAFRVGDVRYRLGPEGLERSFRPLAARLFGLRGREQSFRFEDVRFYRRDRDWSRYRAKEVESLVIGLRVSPYRLVIHDLMGRDAFTAFADRFEAMITERGGGIERRPGFYDSIWALPLTGVFTAAALVLCGVLLIEGLGPTNAFRLLIVIVPG
jgi:hypothetical protein